jgi:hypothetical protein
VRRPQLTRQNSQSPIEEALKIVAHQRRKNSAERGGTHGEDYLKDRIALVRMAQADELTRRELMAEVKDQRLRDMSVRFLRVIFAKAKEEGCVR